MNDWLERTELLLGNDLEKLKKANVLVVGLGGVGSIAAEMLCRTGIGKITIIDGDTIHSTNLNRQIFTRHSNIGENKADVLAAKFTDINPELKLKAINKFITEQEMLEILNSDNFEYIVDAIDTIAPKVSLISNAYKMGIPIVSSMGAGGKIDISKIQVSDISKSYNCTLARNIRKRLHKLGIYKGIKVVFSHEFTNRESLIFVEESNKRTSLGTISYLPAIFGMYAASVVINDLIKK